MSKGLTVYGYESMIQELLDEALNELTPYDFAKLLDGIDLMLDDYEE
jgi:hypothetical protein